MGTISADVNIWLFIAATAVPFLVALVTKQKASGAVKSAANVVLSVVAAVAVAAAQNKGILTEATAVHAFLAYIGSGAVYTHAAKPLGLANKVANIAPSVGVGTAVTVKSDWPVNVPVPLPAVGE